MGLSALGGGAAEPASRGERVEETKNPCMHALPCALTLFVGCVDEDSTYLGNDKEGGLSSHHMSPGVFFVVHNLCNSSKLFEYYSLCPHKSRTAILERFRYLNS
jgi:hypothetical protein